MKDERLLKLGHKIRFERMKRNISQEILAEKAMMSRRAISCIECGTTDVHYTKLEQIADALEIELCELLNFKL